MSRRIGHGFDDVSIGGFPMGGGHRGLGAATPPQAANSGFGRHGSGARGTTSTGFGGPMGITPTASLSPRRQREEDDDGGNDRGRDRERDRSGSRPRQNPAMRPQTTDDIDTVMHRMAHMDGILRKHGQGLAMLEERVKHLDSANMQHDIDRQELDGRMQDGGKNIATRIVSMGEAYDRKIMELEQVVAQLVSGMQTVQAGVQQVQQEFKTRVPQRSESATPSTNHQHFIGTQQQAPPSRPPSSGEEVKTPSPWAQGQGSFGPQQHQHNQQPQYNGAANGYGGWPT